MDTEEQRAKWRFYAARYRSLHGEELKIYKRKAWRKDIERNRAKNRENYHKNKKRLRAEAHLPKRRYQVAKRLAYKRKTIFSLLFEDYIKIISNPCYYCGVSLEFETGASIDRIDNDEGYFLENLLPCCEICNKGRNNIYTVEEWKIMMQACLKYRKNLEHGSKQNVK